MVVMKDQAIKADAGCYSIKYPDFFDDGWRFSMDYDWRTDEHPVKNKWTCSQSPVAHIHWMLLRSIPEHGYLALLDHFGLKAYDISFEQVIATHPSPADLVRMRRAKEDRYGFEYMVIQNMRMGCKKGELADTFEAR